MFSLAVMSLCVLVILASLVRDSVRFMSVNCKVDQTLCLSQSSDHTRLFVLLKHQKRENKFVCFCVI